MASPVMAPTIGVPAWAGFAAAWAFGAEAQIMAARSAPGWLAQAAEAL